MIAFLELIPRWVLVTAVAALLALSGVQTMRLSAAEVAIANERVKTAEAKKEVDVLRLAIAVANTEAANRRAALAEQALKAKNEATKRENDLRAAAAAAAAESDGLRDDLAAMRGKYDQLSRDAVIDRAIAVDAVLSQCTARYQVMAEKAGRHASDVKTLIDAWPRSPPTDTGDLTR